MTLLENENQTAIRLHFLIQKEKNSLRASDIAFDS